MTIGLALEGFERRSQVRLEASKAERDRLSLSYGEYGVRVGVWRLMDFLADAGVSASVTLSGLVAECHPDIIGMLVAGGNDLIGHGWANDLLLADASPEGERAIISRTLDAIENAAGGRRPTGWSSPGSVGSEHTRRILLDEGVTWHGDDGSDDVPFVDYVGDRRIAVLPRVNADANDLIQWVMPGNSPRVFVESFKDTFDTLYAEGARGKPCWSEMTLHAHMAGRPTLVPAIRECIAHVKAHDDVWWTTKSEIAAWTLDQDLQR